MDVSKRVAKVKNHLLCVLKGDVKKVPFEAGEMLKGVAALTGNPRGGPSSLGGVNLIPGINMACGRCTLSREDTTKWGRQCYSDVVDESGRTAGSSLKGIMGMIPPSACGHFASSMMSALVHRYYALRIDTEARRV